MKNLQRFYNKEDEEKGFTLIEMTLVIALMALFSPIVITMMSSALSAKEVVSQDTMAGIEYKFFNNAMQSTIKSSSFLETATTVTSHQYFFTQGEKCAEWNFSRYADETVEDTGTPIFIARYLEGKRSENPSLHLSPAIAIVTFVEDSSSLMSTEGGDTVQYEMLVMETTTALKKIESGTPITSADFETLSGQAKMHNTYGDVGDSDELQSCIE